jgi:uncharacterized membrane protein YsdA (DUF1294 family)
VTALAALLAWLVLVNVGGFALFALDKRAAAAARRRVPERVLLLTAAAGAAPAMVFGARPLRHKTRKQPFRLFLQIILGLQVLAAIGLVLRSAGLV